MQYVCSESDSLFAVLLAAAMFVTSPAGAVAKYCDEYVCLWVCLSVREEISRTTCTIFTKFFVHLAYVRGSVVLRYVYDRLHRLLPGRVFFPLKMHYWSGKGDGSAQRGRSMLSAIALLLMINVVYI